MPTVVEVTVQSSGGDYTTIQGAIDGFSSEVTNTNLVTGDELYRISVEAGTYAETLGVDETAGTDATRYIEIVPQSGDWHDGTAGSGVIVEPTSGSGATLTILDSFTRVRGIEIRADAGSGRVCVELGDSSHTAEGAIVEQCLIYGNGNSSFTTDGVRTGNWDAGTSTNPLVIRSNAIWNCDRAGVFFQNASAGSAYDQYADVIQNTCWDNNRSMAYRARNASSTLTVKIKGNIGGGTLSSTDWVNIGLSSGTVTTTGSGENYSEDADFPGGSATAYTITTSTSPGAGDWPGCRGKL